MYFPVAYGNEIYFSHPRKAPDVNLIDVRPVGTKRGPLHLDPQSRLLVFFQKVWTTDLNDYI